MPTIHDVAKEAGVSVKTVSRVLHNQELVKSKTRDKVHKAIASLNYAPTAMARHLVGGTASGIGMLYGDPSSGYQARLNHAMLKACSEAQRYLAVELFDERSSAWVDQLERFLDRTKVNYMVLVPPMCDSLELHDVLHRRKIRFVLISPSRPIAGANVITMDDRLAGYEATKYLIEMGHKRVAHITGHEKHIVTYLRRRGYEEAILDSNIDLDFDDYIQNGRFRFKEAMTCAEKLFSLKAPPTAIFAANDQMALAVMMVAQKRGLRLPEDLSIMGFDNAHISESVWPPLTTIGQPYDEISTSAVSLLNINSNENGFPSVMQHTLIERGSVMKI